VIRSYTNVRKAARKATSNENQCEVGFSSIDFRYTPPTNPIKAIPKIWKGIIIPAKPQRDRNPLMIIVRAPSDAPKKLPNKNPVKKQISEVNSILGGLGIS
jgi:hypothetical protein